MITLEPGKWVVKDTNTGELLSEHPFETEYQKGKAKEAALAANAAWKAEHGST